MDRVRWKRYALVGVGIAGVLAVFAVLYGWLPWWIDGARLRALSPKDQAGILGSDRGDVLKMVAGAGALVALVYTARKHALDREAHDLDRKAQELSRQTYALSEQGQVTDRYTKAIAQLASEKLPERVGGIYALERIMADSARDHPTVVEVLAAFVRQHAPRPDKPGEPARKRPEADVQAAMTVLARRPERTEPFAMDLRRTALAGLELPAGARLARANLAEADLMWANLTGATLTGANFDRARLARAHLTGATLKKANFAKADVSGARLSEATLTEADLTETLLINANLTRATLTGAHLIGTLLNQADLTEAKLTEADLGGAKLEKANLYRATLTRARLGGADLSRARLGEATLDGAHLSGAMLYEANLSRATLTGANLRGAKLYGRRLGGVKLDGANLSAADLSGAHLVEATLTRADLAGATLTGTKLQVATLIEACGLAASQLADAVVSGSTVLDPALAQDAWVRARIEACKGWRWGDPVPPPTLEPSATSSVA